MARGGAAVGSGPGGRVRTSDAGWSGRGGRAGRGSRRTRPGSVRAEGPTSFLASVGTVAAALRAGAGPDVAWRRVGVRTDAGVPRAADLAALGGGSDRHVAAVRAAARLSFHVGTPAAEMLERATLAVARDAQAENARQAALAGPRATARLLAWLPAVGLLLGAALGARPWDHLLGGAAGTASGLVGLALLVAGRRWTAREIRTAEQAGDVPVAHGPPGGAASRLVPAKQVSRRRVSALREAGVAATPGAGGRTGLVGRAPERLAGEPVRSGGAPAPGPHGPGGRPRAPVAGMPDPVGEDRGHGHGARPSGRVSRLAHPPGPAAVTRLPGDGRADDGTRRPRTAGTTSVETAVLLDLVDGACQAGVGIPRALDAVGHAVGGAVGADLRRAARTVTSGGRWEVAWQDARPELSALARALRPAWEDGVPPGALLRHAAETARRDRDARAAEAAARLGVRLVVPLGLCHLPAFVLLGLVPVLASMATTTLGP